MIAVFLKRSKTLVSLHHPDFFNTLTARSRGLSNGVDALVFSTNFRPKHLKISKSMSYNFCNSEMPGVACPLMGIYLKIIRYVLIYNALQAREEIARNWASVKKRAGGYK